jgi:transposase-like protein
VLLIVGKGPSRLELALWGGGRKAVNARDYQMGLRVVGRGLRSGRQGGCGSSTPLPICDGWMAFSSGYARYVRAGPEFHVWVCRARCRSCPSHALLPSFCLQGRLDSVEVIGPAVEAAVVNGIGTRSVARRAGVKHTTARSWCRRHHQRARRALARVSVIAAALRATTGIAGTSAEQAALSALRDLVSVLSPAAGIGEWPAVSLVTGGQWLAAMRPP